MGAVMECLIKAFIEAVMVALMQKAPIKLLNPIKWVNPVK
jgi:hypothetical protein